MDKTKCCWWCIKRHVCQMPPAIYNPIDKKWGWWFKDTKGFSKDIFKTIAKRCIFYSLDTDYEEGKDIPSCYK